ncbi:RIP metalloprotease RseP [Terribacillus sp. FSL K6-0262]|uniref:RIP metalloprotease RseP n=1 Tax=Terribacillus sp. FSL K6-0262 TaxID=2921447 RepID=UPI0030EC03F0
MTTIIAFILVFGLLVFVHELGHLIFAKRAGMLAREFAIGFGPKIFTWTKNETLYTIRLLPIGGYVRVAGEDPEIVELKPGHHIGLEFNEKQEVTKIIVNNKSKHPNARVIEVESADLDHSLMIHGYEIGEEERLSFPVHEKAMYVMDETETQIAPYDRQFASKNKRQRAMQLFAGPMMNFLLALVLFFILALVQGIPADNAAVGTVQDGSAAQEAGIRSGDEITAIDGTPVQTWEEFTSIVRKNPEKELEVTIVRDGQEQQLQITPALVESGDQQIGQIGVTLAMEKKFLAAIPYSFQQTYEFGTMILTNLGQLITGQLSLDALSGPVGIYDATDQVVKTGLINLIQWTALLSVNLGIVNLVPLPALDGGRLLFIGVEALRGKPVEPQKEAVVHFIGFALLMLLMIVVTWNDIQRLFL